jgi:glutaredoxin
MKRLIFVFLSLFIVTSCATSKWTATSLLTEDSPQVTAPIKEERLVVIYTTDWCYWCKEAKKFMKEHKTKFFERDYDNPEEKTKLKQFADETKYTGRLNAIPLFVIGRKILIGYNAKQILCEIGRNKCVSKTFTTWETPLKQ